jgi:hypothetical protein
MTTVVAQEHMMALAAQSTPAYHPFISHTRFSLENTSHRNRRRSLYWRSESGLHIRRGLLTGIDHGQSVGARAPPR